jgi:hypothetical protein
MTTEPKNKGGRPAKPVGERLEQRSVRLTPAQWAKVEAGGGQPWLRELVDKAPQPPKKKPA